jgi:23S rRNA (cytosine1962-C5)-methyltransferase
MKNRGNQPNEASLSAIFEPKQRWQAREHELIYELRADQGLSPGLFLDQRENRHWVKTHSRGLRVLNLFSYTCGFSLCAAAGDAKDVVSVDVSQSFLEWGKTNFALNGLNPEKYEFWSADSLDFLKRTEKIKREFDLIICDPPSFGRSKRGVFRIADDLSTLVNLIYPLLAPHGILLLSTNYERWSQAEFEKETLRAWPTRSVHKLPVPKPGLDFLESDLNILKTLLLQRP